MKYLLSALLICGAFFSFPSYSQDALMCPQGGQWIPELNGCGVIKPESVCKINTVNTPVNDSRNDTVTVPYSQFQTMFPNNTTGCPGGDTQQTKSCYSNVSLSHAPLNCENPQPTPAVRTNTAGYQSCYYTNPDTGWVCQPYSQTNTYNFTITYTTQMSDDFTCEEMDPFTSEGVVGLNTYCYYVPLDEEPPPHCENDPLNPCPPPPCVRGGNGMMVCKDNPEDKCWVDEWGHTQCEEGCGFVGETFFCATQPDPDEMPNFDKCKFTFNGYACPSEPDDDVPEPDKPLPDMKKQDFKDVNIGVETRQNVTNDLLETLISTNISESENLSKTLGDKLDEGNAGLGQANAYLKQIDINTNAMADDISEFTKPGEIEPLPPEPESWYESEYEDGLKGIWEEKQPLLMATPLFSFVEQFNINPNGNPPDFEMCFNLGAMGNYGCDSFEVPQWIWNAIKVFILFTAAILCRAAVTGV